ncbi:MAG: wax ester/triacylglycerol synthase family O-acyltransferase [Halioglobus sp.]
MEQLTEMDSNFLQQESVRTPMHISPVIVYDQSGRAGGKVRYKEILTVFERNLHKSAIFRRKLAGGAMGLDTPYWVEDPDFDLEFHVRHLALPKPGDWRQFCILLARLQSRGLDMKRPLWEAYVIEGLNRVEGLPENSFAIMLKIHHSAIDGISGAEIVTAIHSLTDEVAPPPVVDTWKGESEPSAWQVWSRAYLHNLKRPVKFVETVGHLVPAIIRAGKLSEGAATERRKPLSAKTRFNTRISPNRVTDALIMDLAEIKAMRGALGDVTINDIMVSIVGGALRNYLLSKDELPADSLIAGAPVNVRSERNSESSGNQVSLMTISMATDIADPVERLRAIHLSAEQSKAFSSALGSSVMMDISEILIPQVLGWGFRAATLAAARTAAPMPCHVVISNVPGPQFPLYLAGARVALMMGMGPLLDMMGLFHAVLSGAGRICINFVACREMMPDPQFYKACLQEAFAELRTAAQALASAPAAATQKSGKKKKKKKKKSATKSGG